METAANNIVRHLYNNVIDSETNEKTCALIRFYKTHLYGQLASGLQEFASGIMGGAPESQDMKCLTMMATAGEHADWNSRSTSSGHRAILLVSADFVGGIPMIEKAPMTNPIMVMGIFLKMPFMVLSLEDPVL